MKNLEIIIGQNVRLLRKQKCWTQTDLAESINMSLDMVGRIERGQAAPSFTTIDKLSKSFDTEPITLLTEQSFSTAKQSLRNKHFEKLHQLLSAITDDELEWVLGIVNAALPCSHNKKII